MSEEKEQKSHDWYGNAISRSKIETPTIELSESWILEVDLNDDSEAYEAARPPTAPKVSPIDRLRRPFRIAPPGASNF